MALDLGETILQLDRVTRNLGQNYLDRRSRLAQLLQAAAAVTPEEAREKTERFYEPFLAAEVVDRPCWAKCRSPTGAGGRGPRPRWTAPTLTLTVTCRCPATCSTWAAAS